MLCQMAEHLFSCLSPTLVLVLFLRTFTRPARPAQRKTTNKKCFCAPHSILLTPPLLEPKDPSWRIKNVDGQKLQKKTEAYSLH
jgi:hypothetical protein